MFILWYRGGTGMKNQVLVGYRVFKKNSSTGRVGFGSLCQKTLASLAIHKHKGLEYVSTTMPCFLWPQNFSAFLLCGEFQINQYLQLTTADLIPNPVGSGIEVQIPGSDPSTRSSPTVTYGQACISRTLTTKQRWRAVFIKQRVFYYHTGLRELSDLKWTINTI